MAKILLQQKESLRSKGFHLISVCDARNEEAQNLQDQIEKSALSRQMALNDPRLCGNLSIEEWLKKQYEEYRFLINQLHRKFLKREILVPNITATVGRGVLAQRLAGTTTYTGSVKYTALGTSNASPTVADLTLGTEVYRKALSSGTFLTNIAYIETFFTASETSGTYQEYGNFIDGSGAADSGQLFNRFIQTTVKSSVETLNVQSQVTFNDG